ncbi:MAG TPA: carboxypeptidase-like regulatory domain-containing protein, partial [Pedobacter sp.]|uniref:carboxypeptidase-like regulatory domain-containing protein n=1 Tax=Pedobacter sp. TaxID=1411316 RepID=UPI002C634C06
FSFFNADGPGNYKVVVEGINAAGELARRVYRYEVEGGTQAQLPELPASKNNDLVKALQGMQQKMPAEKLYVHTDKSYYNLGDTIWFKAYLFDAATLTASKRSGLLYVELNSDTAESVRKISIPIKDGTGYAQIGLSRKMFREGGYTLRAYTNWMQNFGDDYFFTKRFYLGVPSQDTWLVRSSSKIGKVENKDQLQTELFLSRADQTAAGLKHVEIRVLEGDQLRYKVQKQTSADGKLSVDYELKEKADGRNMRLEIVAMSPEDGKQRLIVPVNVKRNQNIDLQLLPEGGTLVAGLKSTVGFKALGEDGKGLSVAGALYDSKNNQVAAFSSLYRGMGSFEFTPKAGESYTARLTEPKDTEKIFTLEVAAASGTVLTVVNPERNDSVTVNIQAVSGMDLSAAGGYLVATSRGVVTYAQQLDEKINNYKIAKNLFPAGTTRFTVFLNKAPVNERIVFIDQPQPLQIAVSTDRSRYYKREKVELEIAVRDKNGVPVKGSFSVAITDSSQVNPDTLDNYGISASLLLNAELRGNVENPGYYLSRRNEAGWQALDNLMLTQGWTGYNWKNAFMTPKKPEFEANPYFRLTGTVVNIANKPVKGAQMLISSQKPAFIAQSLTDSAGRYIFENLPQIDSGSFFIQARTPKGRTMNFGAVSVDKFKAPPVPENFRDQMLPWYVNSDATQLNYVKHMADAEIRSLNLTGNLLREVKINSRKTIKGSYHYGGADIVLDEADIKASGVIDLYELLRQQLPGFKVVMREGFPAIMFNNYYLRISIDGNGLPFQLTPFPTVNEVIAEMKEYKIASFVGLEVMYSRRFTNRLFGAPRVSQFTPGGAASRMKMSSLEISAAGYPGNINFNRLGGQSYTDWIIGLLNGDPEVASIEITTRLKKGWIRNNRPDYATYRPLPVTYPQEFYSPKYTINDKHTLLPDYRSTIFWKPDVTTDVNGKARFSFYTSDVTGNYTVNLQGSDMDGNIGSTASTVKVFNQAP